MPFALAEQMSDFDSDSDSESSRLLQIITDRSLLRDKEFVLSSGKSSSYFFDMKKTMMDPEGSNLIASLILKVLENDKVDAIGGQEIGAVPIVSVVCSKSYYTGQSIPAFFVRKTTKGHGTNNLVDGNIKRGTNVVIVDDVTTTGGSVLKAIEAASEHGCTVVKVITVVDREEGATENLKNHGIELVHLFTRADFE